MPYFRGRPLPQLMRQSSVPQMIYEALTKEDDGAELAAQLAQDLVLCATTNPTDEAARKAAVASFQGGSPMNAAISAGLLTLRGLRPKAAAGQPARPLLARPGRRPGPDPAGDRPGGRHPRATNCNGATTRASRRRSSAPCRAESRRRPRPACCGRSSSPASITRRPRPPRWPPSPPIPAATR